MGKSLIITEKPSVAREFANVLHVNGRQNGYIEDQNYVITWCVGHLVELVYPESYDIKYKKWRLEDLPFLPKEYKYDVKKETKSQYDIVHGMLQREDIDRVYWAGDAGKEGQTIEENIRNFGGVRQGMEELRVWIDSQTEEEILRGIREAKPMSEYANLGLSGIMRTIEDYAMGINFSRVMSIKYGNLLNDAAGTKSYTAIAVGRVMTCVLGMVVIREREIRNFSETPFYRIIGRFSHAGIEAEWKAVEGSKFFESPLLYKENGFKKEEDARAVMDELAGKPAKVISIDKSTTRKRAPLLFNLAELQAECSKKFKISPEETLQIAQDLYEKKLTTYPRTDARVLSSAIAKEISKNISKLRNYEPTHAFVEHIMERRLYENIAKTQYTDDSKVTDHYAIIPTGQLSELNSLNSLQKAVFELIVRRFLSIFYPAAEYENVKLVVGVEKEQFISSAKVLKSQGYLEVATPPKKKSFEEENARILGANAGGDDSDSPDGTGTNGENGGEDAVVVNPKVLMELADTLHSGDEISVGGYEIKYGKTSPPKRYTSGSMILAMENAGQLIEDEELREQIKGSGIGTSATRAGIIDKLVKNGYINLNKKTQILSPERLGEMIYEVVNMTVPALLNPKMTASWEKGLEGITQGTVDFWDYRTKLENYIRTETLKMVEQNLRAPLAERISEFAGKDARGAGARRKIGIACPACGGEMVTTPFGYGCSNYKSDKTGCNFNLGEICGVSLTEEQVKQLFTEGHTDTIRGFKSKAGKKFDACLIFSKDEDGKPSINFDFSNVEAKVVEDVKCPACGGNMVVTSFGYACENRPRRGAQSSDAKTEATDSGVQTGEGAGAQTGEMSGTQEGAASQECYFAVGEIAKVKLTQAQLKQLLTNHATDIIRGFKSKAGKKFDAKLKLVQEEERWNVVFDFEDVTPEIVKDVVCPVCGGEIRKISFGFGCSNFKAGQEDSCAFSIGKIAGKALTVANVTQLLKEGRTETIRGFKSKAGKKFDARLALDRDGDGKCKGIKFDFADVEAKTVKDAVCPICKGKIAVTPYGYSCVNNKRDEENSCSFFIGKIAGVMLKESQVQELLLRKKIGPISGFIAKTGMMFDASLKLTEEGRVEFDFPEKPKPVESDVECPKCRKKMMKAQWNYECECGFKVSHTVAKVVLSEEIIKELLATGKTRNKVLGFTSKAGNVFDACLKFEDDRIQFDFDNPGESAAGSGDSVTGEGKSSDAGVIDFGAIDEAQMQEILGDVPSPESEAEEDNAGGE